MTDDIEDSADEAVPAAKCRPIREGEIDRQNSRVAINDSMCRNPDNTLTVPEHQAALFQLSLGFVSGASTLDLYLIMEHLLR